MALGIERGVCTGRGFSDVDATGFLARFKDWIVKTPANHGPGWYIIRDKSTLPTNITITAVDTVNDIITAPGHGLVSNDQIKFQTTGTIIGGLSASTIYYAQVIDVDTFQVKTTWDPGSASFVNLTSSGSGTNTVRLYGPYIVVSNSAAPGVMGTDKVLKATYSIDDAGAVIFQEFLSPGVTSGGHPWFVWSGPLIKTVDSGSFVYDFRGAGKFLCIQSRIAADAKWYRYISDTFTPLDGFLENTSTVGGYVVDNDTAYTPGSTSMVVKLASSAQASTFTVGEWYFIYFAGNNQSGNPRVNITYGRVDAVGVAGGLDADQIRFSWLSDGESRDFIYYGSHISPYHHCWYTMVGPNFSPSGTYDNTSAFERLIIPYVSYNYDTNRYLAHDQSGSIYQTGAFALDSSVGRGKQDNNYYPLQAGLVYEVYKANYPAGQVVSSDGMNRVYGESDNVFMALGTDFTDMELGIDVNDEVVVSIGRSDLIGSGLSSSYHAFIPDTEST